MNFDNYLNNLETFSHALNPSHICDYPKQEVSVKEYDPFNGHAYVDLGLPSGLLWATMNLGAQNPEDAGSYFAWGETEPKDNYTALNYKWSDKTNIINNTFKNTYDKEVLDLIDDAAHVNWGGNWRMPTLNDFFELLDYCEIEFIENYNDSEINGYIITGKNDNFIFLPQIEGSEDHLSVNMSMRSYDSSTKGDRGSNVWALITNDETPYAYYSYAHFGDLIRPVCDLNLELIS